MHDKPVPPELIPDSLDFEWLVLDILSLDSFYKYEPKENGPPPPPPPQKYSRQTGGCPIYDKQPVPLTPIEKNLVFPEILTHSDIEGPVVVQAFIDEKGIVQKCIVIKGFPGTGIDEAAIDAIKKTPFKPAVQRDRNVGVWIAIPVILKVN